jgi:hypothetical protein
MGLLALATGCATSAKVKIAELTPAAGVPITSRTSLQVHVDFSLEKFQPGRDALSLVFKTRGGGTWEPLRHTLTRAKGRVSFNVVGAELVNSEKLAHPVQMLVALDRWGSDERREALAGSDIVVLNVDASAADLERRAKQLAPSIGKGQLLSDLVNDPAIKPRLPPSLNRAGNVVWGLYKICVDSEGDVFKVEAIRHAHPDVDDAWQAILRRLKHLPYTVDNEPVPYCYPMRLEVRSMY